MTNSPGTVACLRVNVSKFKVAKCMPFSRVMHAQWPTRASAPQPPTPMKHLRLIATLLWVLTGQASTVTAQSASPRLEDYDVVWNKPSADSSGSMPVGNGDIALNAWMENNGDLVFYIGKNDAWSGDTTSPGYGAYGLIKLGRVRVSLSPNPFAPPAQGFRQSLLLREGLFEASVGEEGKKSVILLWVDANRPVIHVQCAATSPVQMKVSLESWRTEPNEWLGADTILTGQKNRVAWYYRSINRQIPELTDRMTGGLIEGKNLVSKDASTLESASPATTQEVSIHTLTMQAPDPAEWLRKLEAQVASSDATPLDTARKEHDAWWSGFWDRSHIFITAGEKAREVTTGYLLQRYINACSSRGDFPIKFNGSLFVIEPKGPIVHRDKKKEKPDIVTPGTADFRGWGYQYWFQNTRPVYWPMMASGDYDLMRPFFRMYRGMLEGNSKLVQQYYGHEGAYFRETGPFWGGLDYLPPESHPGYTLHYYTPILEYSAMGLDYYAHTGDKDFARNTLVPMADAGITFFDKHFKRDDKGKLFISPANAIETFWKVNNPTPDVAGLHWVLTGLLALPDDLGTPAMRAHWKKLLDELPPIPIGEGDGGKRILTHESPVCGGHNMENPELYAVYPFRIYGLGKPDYEMAKRTFDTRRNKWFGCWSQNGTQAALLGDAATARAAVIKHLTARDRRFRFPAFWPAGFDYSPDQDNGGNGLHALQTMLLQSEGDKITVLPAWPKDWDADFKLHAPKMTTVEGTVRAGALVDLKVTPPERRKDVTVLAPQ